MEDVGILCKETEDQPRHGVLHRFAAFVRGSIGILPKQFDVKLVQSVGGTSIDRVILDFFQRGDSGKGKEEA